MSKISELVSKHLTTSSNDGCKFGFNAEHLSTQPMSKSNKELVNHPNHYQSKTGLEAIDVIEAFGLNFNLGNVVKYILRCGKKDDEVQELEKAKWYLEREIASRKQ